MESTAAHSGFCIFVQLFSNRCIWPAGPAACLYVVLLMFYSKIQTLTESLRRVSPSSLQLKRFATFKPLLGVSAGSDQRTQPVWSSKQQNNLLLLLVTWPLETQQ